MPSFAPDSTQFKNDPSSLLDSKELDLSNIQRAYLRVRWLEQMQQVSRAYRRAFRSYKTLRLVTVVGCLVILMLVSLSYGAAGEWVATARLLTIFLSLSVSVCVVVEQLYEFGEQARRHERVAERLKAEGWRFLQLSGHYHRYRNHADAFATFAGQIEALSQRGVEVYNFDVVRDASDEATPREVAAPKKLASSPPESLPLTETPTVMHPVARRQTS
ncbi:MAG: DUF4231 domain-containing protein [Pyrinomonadaceae bacterium]